MPQTSKKTKKPPHNWRGQKEKEKEGIRLGPELQGRSYKGRKAHIPWEVSSLAVRSDWMEGELQSLRGEHSNQFVGGKRESNLHRRLALPPCAPQPETLVGQCGQGLGAIAQALEVRPRERTRVGCVETA